MNYSDAGIFLCIIVLLLIISIEICIIYFQNNAKENIIETMNQHTQKIRTDIFPSIEIDKIFDRIYLISLPSRKGYISEVMESFSINPIYVEAIPKEILDPTNLVKDGIVDKNYNYKNLGRVACHLSHIKVLRTFLATKTAKIALILEDDLKKCSGKKFYKKRMKHLSQEIKRIENSWDVIYLGHCWTSCLKLSFISEQLCKGGNPLCRHAYVVSRSGAQKIIENTLPMYNNGDEMMKLMNMQGLLRVLTLMPPIFFQNRNDLKSNLENFKKLKVCGDLQFSSSNISVVIPHYARPHNLKILIPQLLKYPEIGEIIISHGNPKHFVKIPHAKNIKNYYLNDLYGAAHRFFSAIEAKNEFILFVDDDTVPSHKLVQNLLLHMEKDPMNIYGPFSKKCTIQGYDRNPSDNYNMILTSTMMTNKLLIKSFVTNFHQYADKLFETKGNGEDLLFNYHVWKILQKTPIRVKGDFETLDRETHSYKNISSHYPIREQLCKNMKIPEKECHFALNNNNKIHYRLGDMVFHSERRKETSGYELHKKLFPNSIATKYMDLTKHENDLDILMKIIEKKKNLAKMPNENTLVIHLRTGDVIDRSFNPEKSSFDINDLLSRKKISTMKFYNYDKTKKNNVKTYVKSLQYYEEALESFVPPHVKHVVFVTGFHKTDNHDKSMKYVESVRDYFKKKGYLVSIRLNQNPDDDFLYMCNSKYFIQSGGGFSALISEIVQKKNGNVYFSDKL